ncbi:MAG: hypothetical protein NUW13_06450 [candidate division KSB1 bacterium]|jgi:hypothetical protein|nr:hypothetical protein [candidate division KSB1 bacterium]
MGSPVGVGIRADGGVVVAEVCCRLHEFTPQLRYRRTFHWPVEILQLSGKQFAVIGSVALVTLPPLPPARTDVIHLFALASAEPRPVGSFLPYATPRRSFKEPSLQRGAVSSRNIVVFATHANRYVALSRAGEPQLVFLDLQQRRARRFVLRGKAVETVPKGDTPGPPYAVVQVVKDIAFDPGGRIYVLVRRYGILILDPGTLGRAWLYTRAAPTELDAQLADYYGVAASNDQVYLVSPGLAQLAICSCEGLETKG